MSKLGIKKQVHVGAHPSADVLWDSEGGLLRLTEHSAFAGKVLKLPGGDFALPPQTPKSTVFRPFSYLLFIPGQTFGRFHL